MGSVNRDTIVNAAVTAEQLGFYALWPNEFFVSRPDVSARYNRAPNLFDAVITMAYALAATRRIRITPSVLILPLHEPILLARQFATLDVFSEGRVTMGIGLGGTKEEFTRMRPDSPNRSKLMEEQVAAMRALWTEESATYHGQYVRFTDLETFPKPIQNPLPVMRAGHGDAAIHWIAQHGQGWIDSSHDPDEIGEIIGRLKELARDAGRPAEDLEFARQWYVSLGETQAKAEANFAESLPPVAGEIGDKDQQGSADSSKSRTGPTRTLIGTPDSVRDELRRYADTGLTEMSVIFYSPDAVGAERQMHLFAGEVMEKF